MADWILSYWQLRFPVLILKCLNAKNYLANFVQNCKINCVKLLVYETNGIINYDKANRSCDDLYFGVTFEDTWYIGFLRAVYTRRLWYTCAQADVPNAEGEFQRQAGAASALRCLPGHHTCRQQTIQVRLSPVVVDRRRQGWSCTEHAALPASRLTVQRRPARQENGRLVRETQAD